MVLTKFIEGAREVEMDAVGKDGRVSALSPDPRSLPSHQVSFLLLFFETTQIKGHDFYKTGL